eukprot:COSAG03_NODE_1618_length_3766_cov_3.309517_2_plen_103_part_00
MQPHPKRRVESDTSQACEDVFGAPSLFTCNEFDFQKICRTDACTAHGHSHARRAPFSLLSVGLCLCVLSLSVCLSVCRVIDTALKSRAQTFVSLVRVTYAFS